MKGRVIVTGGAGYIGSHTIVDLLSQGFEVVSLDNYVNSSRKVYDRIKAITNVPFDFHEVDICNYARVNEIIEQYNDVTGIIHFAALKAVGESVEKPLDYYHNNLTGLINILRICKVHDIRSFIFSSSCTVYGIPKASPVDETTPLQEAESPYGATKQMGERIVRDAMQSMKTQSIMLRYFNPAGAHPSGKIGESPITMAYNLVPAITETAIGKRGALTVFGTDYNTRDGSCIRDYIHVMDLARAHTLALSYLIEGRQSDQIEVFNLGIGEGVTVLEVIQAFEDCSGLKLNYIIGERRPGDVPAIYSNYTKINKLLKWKPGYTIKDIMETAWQWEKNKNSQY